MQDRLRNRAKASLEQEAKILDEVLNEAAATGGVVIVPSLKPAVVEARLGKPLALSTLYQMLARHGWRKLAPDKSHPKPVQQRARRGKNSPSG